MIHPGCRSSRTAIAGSSARGGTLLALVLVLFAFTVSTASAQEAQRALAPQHANPPARSEQAAGSTGAPRGPGASERPALEIAQPGASGAPTTRALRPRLEAARGQAALPERTLDRVPLRTPAGARASGAPLRPAPDAARRSLESLPHRTLRGTSSLAPPPGLEPAPAQRSLDAAPTVYPSSEVPTHGLDETSETPGKGGSSATGPAEATTLETPTRAGQSRENLRHLARTPRTRFTAQSFESRLRARYELDDAKLQMRDGALGAAGRFDLRGDFTPAGVAAATPRAAAEAFLAAELETFGLADFGDLHEAALSTTELGWTTIVYERYVGDLPLRGVTTTLRIDPQRRIRSVSGVLEPVGSELVELSGEPGIDAAGALDRVEADLGGFRDSSARSRARVWRDATTDPPRVAWTVRVAGWQYVLDARSGEILERTAIHHE